MIYIDRERVDECGRPIHPGPEWAAKAANATNHAIASSSVVDADRTIYADDKVTAALEKLFHGKCAYCEKNIVDQEWDVEHFRPKGRVAECEEHPGYYWLAYEWDNLYVSCTKCNRRRRDKPSWDSPQEGPTAGKFDQFPLLDESTRAMTHEDDILEEQTLLVDPCYDDPEDYVSFLRNGDVFSLNGNPYGDKTIEVFNLQRRRLRKLRAIVIEKCVEALEEMRDAETAGDLTRRDRKSRFVEELAAESELFSGAVRSVLRDPTAFGV